METYAPNLKDLASRDVCSRSIYQEVRAGRGIGGKDYVHLDIRAETINKYKTSPTGEEVDSAWVEKRLPDIIDFARTYLGVDPIREPMPIQPTAHYAMGGLPTDVDGRVIRDPSGDGRPRPLRRGRERLRERPRRQPAGDQQPGRPGRLRPPLGPRHGPPRPRSPVPAAPAPPREADADRHRRAPGTPEDRALGQDPRRDAAGHDGRLRRLPDRGEPHARPRRHRRP